MTTLNLTVAAGADDAFENEDESYFTSTTEHLYATANTVASDRMVAGVRLDNVTVPAGATINTAYLQVVPYSAALDDPRCYIHLQDEDDPVNFSDDADVYQRSRTTDFESWIDTGLYVDDVTYVTSPTFAIAVKEVVDRPGWNSGQAMVVLVRGYSDQNSAFLFRSHEYGKPAKFDIDYSVGVVSRSVAGSQPAATGALTRKEQAARAVAGTQPAPSGTVVQTAGSTFSRTVAGNQPAPSGAVARSAGAFTRTAAGAQPAPLGALSRIEQAVRAVAGDQPESTGALTRKEQALRATAGNQPEATGTVARTAGTFARPLAGSQPASGGTLTRKEQALRAVAGAQAAPSGAVARIHRRLRSVAGNQPAALGTIVAVLLVTRRTITGVQPAPSGTLTKVGAFARSLAGDQPAATGTLAQSAGSAFSRSLAGAQPAAVGALVRSKHWLRSIAGDQPFATGIVTLRVLVLRPVPDAHAQLAPFSPSAAVVVANLDENPSFETNLDGVGINDVLVSLSGDEARYGEYSCYVERTGATPYIIKSKLDGSGFPALPGETYIHSVWGRHKAGGSGSLWVYLTWYDSEDNFITSDSWRWTPSDSSWMRCSVVGIAPANAAFVRLVPLLDVPQVGDVVYLDGQELRQEPSYVGPYIDGDQEGYYWLGVPHASVSARAPALSLPRGRAIAVRTMEGEARTGAPLASGKAR